MFDVGPDIKYHLVISKFETNWKNNLVAVVSRDRVDDDTLREGI